MKTGETIPFILSLSFLAAVGSCGLLKHPQRAGLVRYLSEALASGSRRFRAFGGFGGRGDGLRCPIQISRFNVTRRESVKHTSRQGDSIGLILKLIAFYLLYRTGAGGYPSRLGLGPKD